MANPQIEFRIWERSELVGKTIRDISNMGVCVYKITRGSHARNPPEDLKIEAFDYVGIVGNRESCLQVVKKAKP